VTCEACEALKARVSKLEEALGDVIEEYAYAAQYKGSFFEKHGDAEKIAEFRAALSAKQEAKP